MPYTLSGILRFTDMLSSPLVLSPRLGPVGHPGKFLHGLVAPVTTALGTGRRHPIFIALRGLYKAMRNYYENGHRRTFVS